MPSKLINHISKPSVAIAYKDLFGQKLFGVGELILSSLGSLLLEKHTSDHKNLVLAIGWLC